VSSSFFVAVRFPDGDTQHRSFATEPTVGSTFTVSGQVWTVTSYDAAERHCRVALRSGSGFQWYDGVSPRALGRDRQG
jgi:hypothetical protein